MVAWAASVVIQGCYLHVYTKRAPLEQCLAWLVRVMYLSCFVLVPCLYPLYMPARTYLPALVLVLYLYRRTVCTVLCLLYNESASPCSYSYCGYTITQCVSCLYLLYSGCMARVNTGACLLHFACVRAVRCSAWIVRAVVHLVCVCVCVRQSVQLDLYPLYSVLYVNAGKCA